MYYVYILRSEALDYTYKGMTNNLDRRLKQHNSGLVGSTKSKIPFKILHVEICENRKDARELEKYFKSGSGREIIEELFA
ncbi:MAG: GIY-YIG nuclease family protein [Candidatus Curtissbacteria bacterium]|nr:GIY-YIG nuclease family protein [Candidatus Curtissbacteria bacterium]